MIEPSVAVCDCRPQGLAAEVIPGLCRRPERACAFAERTGAERLVLGVCADGASTHEFQAWARRAGLDPFALELVRLEEGAAVERVSLLLAAATARVRAFRGSDPEELRPRLLAGARSRRSLLALPPVTYEAVARVDGEECTGCGVCVDACLAGAIGRRGSAVVVDRGRCTGCGLCVTACPAGAVRLPGSSLEQSEAELGALIDGGVTDVVLACREVGARVEPPWFAVRVPCAAMVTPGWALQALARGARRVRVAACDGCPAAARVEARSRYVATVRASTPAARARGPLTLREPAATVLALTGAEGVSVDDVASPLGAVELRTETCTLCGTCAGACPTGALAIEQGETEAVLSFDATRCVACGRCAAVCPEAGTLSVSARTDSSALAAGRRPLARARVVHCRGCGRSIAPARLLVRIAELLGPAEPEPLLRTVSTLCGECRAGAAQPAAAHAPAQAARP